MSDGRGEDVCFLAFALENYNSRAREDNALRNGLASRYLGWGRRNVRDGMRWERQKQQVTRVDETRSGESAANSFPPFSLSRGFLTFLVQLYGL